MYEIYRVITDSVQLFNVPDLTQFLIPKVGVGGGIEAKEHVELLPVIKATLLFLAAIGAVFGIALALTAKKFSVKIDPKIEKVKDALAHAH